MATDDLSRRTFLARIGVLGASVTLLPQCVGPNTGTATAELSLGVLVNLLRPVLGELSRDTWNGFVAFSLPGRDAYSRAQGTPRSERGGIEAGGTDFLIRNLDRFLPFPDELVRPAAAALVTALRDLPLPVGGLLAELLGLSPVTIRLVEDAVRFILENDNATPLSLPVLCHLSIGAERFEAGRSGPSGPIAAWRLRSESMRPAAWILARAVSHGSSARRHPPRPHAAVRRQSSATFASTVTGGYSAAR